MFEGFDEFDVTVPDATIHGRRAGHGSPVLFLHGFPQSHVMWHRLAPELAGEFTVVATDLGGFGDSTCSGEHSMRALARQQVEVMRTFGYDEFAVVGHDRGARCAAASTDDALDREDRGVRRISCPVLALWRQWADDVSGATVNAGHFMPEEAPAETLAQLLPFLRAG